MESGRVVCFVKYIIKLRIYITSRGRSRSSSACSGSGFCVQRFLVLAEVAFESACSGKGIFMKGMYGF